MATGASATFKVSSVSPATVSDKSVTWSISPENNVTISYILNELIRSVDNFENRPRFGMIKNEGDNS